MNFGINNNLANEARVQLLMDYYNERKHSKVLLLEFDEKGDVKRDFKKELDTYCEDELKNILPQVDVSIFDSHRRFQKQQHSNAIPKVDKVKLAPIDSPSYKQLIKRMIRIKRIRRLRKFRTSIAAFFYSFM
jgi:hypothetical protein